MINTAHYISWLKSKMEAKYWYDELGNFIEECWYVVKDMYDKETLKKFIQEVDELTKKYEFGNTIQAMLGAAMIRRFLHSRYPEIDKKLSGVGEKLWREEKEK